MKRARYQRTSHNHRRRLENATVSESALRHVGWFDGMHAVVRSQDAGSEEPGESEEEPMYDPTEDSGENGLLLTDLGPIDPHDVMAAIESISDHYLSDLEADLVWLMRQGRRPVEISRILKIPECEVVRLRRNCFRKIRTVFLYDHQHDKARFLAWVEEHAGFSPKQLRVLTMFFQYHGLRQIAETIGSRPSNVHRSLEMMRRRLLVLLPDEPPLRFFLGAFKEFKYLCLTIRPPRT